MFFTRAELIESNPSREGERVISTLKPYPAYKDSGVEWLGQVPEHWEVQRLRNIVELRVSNVDKHSKEGEEPVRLCNYVDVYRHERIRANMEFMKATASIEEIERFRLEQGDVLITKDSEAWDDIGVPALIESSAPDLISGYHLALLRPRQVVEGAFLLRALQSPPVAYQFHVEAKGVTRYGLSHDAIKSTSVPLPPLPEQTAIVHFLDYMDRRIRRYIRARQKLIKLLEEYKQALIHQAVTGQIDVRTGRPYPTYKDSGVEWLGEVPEHWEVVPLRRVASGFNNGTSVEQISIGTTAFPVSRIETISTGTINYDKVGFIREENVDSRFWLEPGDILLSHINSFEMVGNCAQFLGERPLLHGMNLIRIRPKNRVVGAFMFRFMKSSAFRYEMRALCKPAINQVSVTTTAIKGIHMPLPPLPEQTAIAEYLDAQTAKIDAAMAATRREIELLREYRTRLIADVVTGKVDVREVAAQLPEEPEEPELLVDADKGEDEASEMSEINGEVLEDVADE